MQWESLTIDGVEFYTRQKDFYTMAHLVSTGLTVRNFHDACSDLSNHLLGGVKVEVAYQNGDLVGFGIYKEFGKDHMDFSFIVDPHCRGKGLGRHFLRQARALFPKTRWLTGTTQNYAAYLAFRHEFGDRLVAPVFNGERFLPLEDLAGCVITGLKQYRHIDPDERGYIYGHYGFGGLYAENVNVNNPFPIDSKTGDGILLIVDNS